MKKLHDIPSFQTADMPYRPLLDFSGPPPTRDEVEAYLEATDSLFESIDRAAHEAYWQAAQAEADAAKE